MMGKTTRILIGSGIVALVVLGIWLMTKPPRDVQTGTTVIGLTNGSSTPDAGFARAVSPRIFTFPLDHGPHLDFQTEWWYYTGNVHDATGQLFGYQLTFFRRALLPPQDVPPRRSDLASNQIYFAHFAITDIKAGQHEVSEQFSRGAAGLAGAFADPFRVFVYDWSASATISSANSVHLSARQGANAISLNLLALKPVVLEGQNGLSAKSEIPGNASYYYSFTRMATHGTLTTRNGTYDVDGLSWMDHEWSTSALGPHAQGWDWFALQLSDQRDVMLFQIRNNDGSIDPASGGTLVLADGSTRTFSLSAMHIQVLQRWRSPQSGAEYPVRWYVTIPQWAINLVVTAQIDNQENRTSVVYWEGAVNIQGLDGNQPVTGAGYVELTGYSQSLNGGF